MRVSTTQFQRQAVEAMLDNHARLARTELQIATGERIITPADDPAGAKRILDLSASVQRHRQLQDNADAATNRLSLEESVLSNVTQILQRVRELAVQGNNTTLSPSNRQAIATEVSERLDELVSLANTRDAGNEYLFSGHQAGTQPFSRSPSGAFLYNGDQGQRRIQAGQSLQVAVSDPGSEVFQSVRGGNGTFVVSEGAGNAGDGVISTGTVVDRSLWTPDTYTLSFTSDSAYEVRDSALGLVASGSYAAGDAIGFAGAQVAISGAPVAGDTFTVQPSPNRSVFGIVQSLADALGMPADDPASKGHFGNAMSRAVNDIDRALESVIQTRTEVGARLNAVESQRAMDEEFVLFAQQSLSEVQDLDYAEASSRLQLQLLTYQASQQAFVKVQSLSLFNFLR